ncbi:unnamed protein product [Echinostoma caproni]|uniref:Gamma-aminobutyric acid receptor subunit beta-like n=1 Tax=Echinostoma caproni TaxID=27848 RepID=A0A183AQ34_9TREM|nr:unnamed protein product [Echinostoma caproni]
MNQILYRRTYNAAAAAAAKSPHIRSGTTRISTTTTPNPNTTSSSKPGTGNADRKHIVICEPSPTFRGQAGGPKRVGTGQVRTRSTGSFPKKSALKVSQSQDQYHPPRTGRSRQLDRSYLSGQIKSLFHFTRLHTGTQSANVKQLRSDHRTARSSASQTALPAQTPETYDSEVDAYSRFLFPACFVLFNCCYWLFYMIIADDHPPEPS